jgi:cyanate permease
MTSKKRSFIIDLIIAAAASILILTSAVTSVFALIFQPDREAWQIALSWISLAVTVAVIIFVVVGARRALKDFDREVAEQGEHKAKLREVIKVSHTERPNTADVTVSEDPDAEYRLVAGEPYHDPKLARRIG